MATPIRVHREPGVFEDDLPSSQGPRRLLISAGPIDQPAAELLTRALAQAALQAWPDWTEPKAARVFEPWMESAQSLAARGDLPLPPAHPRSESVRFLGRLLGALRIDVLSPELDEARADALSRALEWLSSHVEAEEIRWHVPSDASFPGVLRLPEAAPPMIEPAPGEQRADVLRLRPGHPTERARHGPPAHSGSKTVPSPWQVRLEPILGRPHPASPAEQVLFSALEATDDLAGRFRPNHPVSTVSGRRLIVDLLNDEAGLVVEVDGFAFHASPAAFARDRDRDYRLLATGLRVLRLTHDEIMASVDSALDKIRTVLHPNG